MGETVFEQITKSPEVLAKFLKPYIDETNHDSIGTILYHF